MVGGKADTGKLNQNSENDTITIKRDRPFRPIAKGSRMIRVKISASPNKCMTGVELKRVMAEAGLTPYALSKRLGWYKRRIQRLLDKGEFDFELHPVDMADLLKALGATSL